MNKILCLILFYTVVLFAKSDAIVMIDENSSTQELLSSSSLFIDDTCKLTLKEIKS